LTNQSCGRARMPPADDGNESQASTSKKKKTQEAEYADTDNHDTYDV